ncbi:B12-binding domain-containing radical SAM protein [Geomonas limicola]|uniref:B12-binding domain-containing radical SAM protein n=1 Tax=Geomonas limicola TaxID=2740186 RepID=A0A6V8N9N1_9BACT|nr:radical SAM protein [Geomonas limicola]GFO68517.1 B12-binding domain-containing radical SAM protein [Geomonas limicola]
MNVLLVNPPVPSYYHNREFYLPSGLLYIASSLSADGNQVELLDLKTFDSRRGRPGSYESLLEERLRAFEPDLIGFGCLFSGNFQDILGYARRCKEVRPQTPILLGGIHPTIYPAEILANCPELDWIVLAEGEQSTAQLVRMLEGREPRDFGRIDGFAYRAGESVLVNEKKGYIEDLDALPFPAYELIDIEDYHVDTDLWHNPRRLPINTSVPIISSRSCPHKCPFCSMFKAMGPAWRPRSARNVVDEIEEVYHRFGQRHFSFMDDNFSLSKRRTIEICNEIVRRGLAIQFETPNGLSVNTLDAEVMAALAAAGLVRISLAIESGSDYIRNQVMRKNTSREKIFEAVRLSKSYPDMYVKAFFVIGSPEETRETLEETYTMIRDIDVDKIHLMNMVPFPSTPIFQQAVRDNLLVDGLDVDNFYRSSELYVANYSTFFIKPYALTLEELREFRTRCEALIAEQASRRATIKQVAA